MHMADALVAPAVAATMYVWSRSSWFFWQKVRLERPEKDPSDGSDAVHSSLRRR